MDRNQTALQQMYAHMLEARKFDEAQIAFYKTGREPMEGVHSYIGQEAVGVGVGMAMKEGDILVPSLRSRPAFFARGVPIDVQWAGVFKREKSPGKGVIGSRHMTALEYGIAGTTGIVGSQIPLATGIALALKARGNQQAAVCLFGDGAANRGDCHEAMNMAAIYKAPVVFVCEANGVAESQNWESYMPIDDLSVRAQSYGIPGLRVDGNDVEAVYASVTESLQRARDGKGPSFVVAETCRLRSHVEGLPDFRSAEFLNAWRERDPITVLRERLLAKGLVTTEDLQRLDEETESRIATSLEDALSLPLLPADSLAELVYMQGED